MDYPIRVASIFRRKFFTAPQAIFVITVAFFFFFFALPIWETVNGAFRLPGGKFTLAYFIEVFRNPIYLEGLWNSVIMAVFSTGFAILIALPLALLTDRYLFPGKNLFSALLL